MPDILIRGMEMPTSCDVCPFVGTNDVLMCDDYRYLYCGFPYMGMFVSDYIAARHQDCPLVEVPQHGDLIDRKALFEKHFAKGYVDNVLTATKDKLENALLNIPMVINNFPAIIPADKEVNEDV